ncbi:hypothetical protein NN561_003881 [Cricetulus griseus]
MVAPGPFPLLSTTSKRAAGGQTPALPARQPRRPPRRRSTREVHGAGRALRRHGSAWPVMLRAAGTGSQGPAPGRAMPLSGNAKPEAWLPELQRCSRGSRPGCCSLPQRRDTAPAPPRPQARCFFACSFLEDEERGARRHSSAPAMLGLGGAQHLAPCSWQPFGCLAGRRILTS